MNQTTSSKPPNLLRESLRRAVARHRNGQLAEAKAIYEKILRRHPLQPDALNLLGLVCLSRGDIRRAVDLIHQASALRPNEASIASNLGNALWQARRTVDAENAYRTAIAIDPLFAPAHVNLGLLLTEADRVNEAVPVLRRAIALDATPIEGRQGLADAYRRAGRHAEAEHAYRAILADKPAHAAAATGLGSLLAELDRISEALEWHTVAIGSAPAHADHFSAFARTCYRGGDVERAVKLLRRALELNPQSAQNWNELGRALRAQGNFREAASCFEQAVAIEPKLADAHRNIALIDQAGSAADPARALDEILADPKAPQADRILAGFGLGKLMDDRGRFDDAFGHYARANDLVKASNQALGQVFDSAAFHEMIDRTIAREPSLHAAPSASELPVFIVGMPRSGTSLVEQIVASHPLVFGAGELRHVGRLSAALSKDGQEHAALAEEHVAYLRSLAPAATRVVDKMPDNVFHLQTIEALFPNARVIFCHRDPRDVCLSCYFQLFTSGNLFSYDLRDCGHRHLGVDRLVAHAMATTRLTWTMVNYEDVVDDLEGESRRLLDFLNVSWDPACLEFHRTPRSVRTASGWQVRQNLFRSSMGRWRHYEAHVGALIDVLDTGPQREWTTSCK